MKKSIIAIFFASTVSFLSAGGYIAPAGNYHNADEQCSHGDVYIDYDTNLMWQDEAYGDQEDYASTHNRSRGKAGSWSYAKNYCDYLVYAGYDDWRLPTIDELIKLYDKKVHLKNTIDVDFWSSSPSKGNTYWTLYTIVTGQPYAHKKSDSHYFRCVRCLRK